MDHHQFAEHYFTPNRPNGLSSDDLYKLVLIAEKYDCLNAVRGQVSSVLAALRDEHEYVLDLADTTPQRFLESAVTRVAVSYIIKDKGQFSKNCQDIIDHFPLDESLVNVWLSGAHHLVPRKIFRE